MAQKRPAGGVQVHPHRVDAAFHHAPQGAFQPGGGHIVLVLPHPDGLGVNFYQLRQGVLEPPGDGNRAAQVYVKLGELLAGQLAGGIDRGPRLAHHHIGEGGLVLRPQLPDKLRHQPLRFPAGGAVADGDDGNLVLPNQGGELSLRLLHPVVGLGGVDDGGIQHLACSVHHSQLAAVAVAGIQPQHHPVLHRGLHQQVVEVFPKDLDGLLAGGLKEGGKGLVFHGGGDKALPAVPNRLLHRTGAGIFGGDYPAADETHRPLLRELDGRLQQPLLHPPADSQHPVGGNAPHRLRKIGVHGVGAAFRLPLLLGGSGDHQPFRLDEPPQLPPDIRVIGDILRQDVQRPLEGGFRAFHPLFRVQIVLRQHKGLRQGGLGPDSGGQGLQALLPGHAGAGAALLLIGAVEVLHHRQGLGGGDGLRQLRGQLSLLPNGGEHLLLALLQVPQVF